MVTQRHYIIFVPGIRDDLLYVQSFLIQCWRFCGVRPVMLTMPWLGAEEFEPKLARLVSRIDNYWRQGHRVSLVGASAGASAVLNAYSQRNNEIESVAYICGKVNHPDTVSNKTYDQNPAFKTSMLQLQNTLSLFSKADKRKIRSFYSTADTTVPYMDTVIGGISEKRLPSFGHMWAILYALSFGSVRLLQALKILDIRNL